MTITRGRQSKPVVNTFDAVLPMGVAVTTPMSPAVQSTPPVSAIVTEPLVNEVVVPVPIQAPVPQIDPIAASSFEARKAEFDPSALTEVVSGSGVEMGPFVVERSDNNSLKIALKTGPGLGQKADWFVSELQSGTEKLLVTAVRYQADTSSGVDTVRPGPIETTPAATSTNIEPTTGSDTTA